MDKILAFSILSSSPADIAATGYSTRLSWRPTAGSKHQQQQNGKAPGNAEQEENSKAGRSQSSTTPERKPRFAPEFDGLNCFESIVSF